MVAIDMKSEKQTVDIPAHTCMEVGGRAMQDAKAEAEMTR